MSQLADIAIIQLSGVGPKLAEKLAKCGIVNLQDLLLHLPFRYQDRTRVSPIRSLRPHDHAVIEGVIEQAEIKHSKRASLLLSIHDGTAAINIRFFYFNATQKNQLQPGVKLRCFGEARHGFRGLEMVHPEYRRILSDEPVPVEETLTPIYPATEGLTQKSIRNLTDQALRWLQQEHALTDLLPEELLQQLALPKLEDAVLFLHRPPPDASVELLLAGGHPAQKRLAFEELLAHRLSLRKLRAQAQQHQAAVLNSDGVLVKKYLQQLPFIPTKAQQKVSKEIKVDLAKPYPMLRLVQGDVGSGKTIVAAMAMLEAVACGQQAALMAPTDILAEQHYRNFCKWLEPLGLNVAWLAGKHKGKLREQIVSSLVDGSAEIAIGTHALFQEKVSFKQLALIVVDEQHRFGVHQRLALREKGAEDGQYPHQLIMTATPIPRTLSMTAYADLDVSIIDELPPGRTPVKTVVIAEHKRQQVIDRIQQVCQQGRQVYWVCPLIEESEVLQCQAAEKTFSALQQQLVGLRIGLVHGRMKTKEKEAVMQQFKDHQLDLLVATTVIEVGVDVPNASLMIMENAERLGLSQLHQLRGRVGRGVSDSYCVLLYQGALSPMAKERLRIMRQSNDGFVIAQKDLELRGPGEVLGTKQTGVVQFRIADLQRDQALLPKVQQAASLIMQQYPQQVDPIIKRWLGTAEKYAVV